MNSASRIPEILRRQEGEILADWIRQQQTSASVRGNVIKDGDLREQSRAFLATVREALDTGSLSDIHSPAWAPARDFIVEMARARARQGFTPVETATFIFSLKLPIFSRL